MFRLLIPCLIWLLGVRSESTSSMHMPDGMMEEKMAMKRESYFNPCPPDFSHPISYSPPPQLFVKPFVQPAPVQYIPKPMITYVKPPPPPVVVKPSPLIVKPIAPPKLDFSFFHQKPMLSYAPIFQKPLYYEQSFQKLSYQPPKVYFKKFELPPIAPVIQKPQISYPIQHYQSKVLQVQPPQINFLKLAQPIIHSPPAFQSAIKPWCP